MKQHQCCMADFPTFCLEALSRSTCTYAEHCGLHELSQHEIGTWGSWGKIGSSEMTSRHLQRSLQSLLRLHLYLGNTSSNCRLNDSQSSHKARHWSSHNPGKTVTSFHVSCSLLMWPSYFYVKEVLIVSPWIWGDPVTILNLQTRMHALLPCSLEMLTLGT